MARKSRKQPAIAQDQALDEMRDRLKARLSEWREDPIPDEPRPQMRDAMRNAVTYSAPVPIR
jgi:hypothetical protein